jgi:hypothetical protein
MKAATMAPHRHGDRSAARKATAVCTWALGLMFGLPCAYGIWYLADTGQVWTFLGFPVYGGGPWEDFGIDTTVPLLVGFLLVCAAELVLGWMLWRGNRDGVPLAFALLPLEIAFWIGFALPLGPVLGLARTAMLLLSARRSSLLNARIASVLTWFYTAYFGIPAIPVGVYVRQHGTLPTFGDLFELYGGPWSVKLQDDAFIVALAAFFAVTLVVAWTAWLIWYGSRTGAVVNLLLLPIEALFWQGFALPIPWFFGIARTTLLAIAWRSLNQRGAGSTTGRQEDQAGRG